jgi:hypothetical protein
MIGRRPNSGRGRQRCEGDDQSDHEQASGRRQRRRSADPGDQIRAEPLPDRTGDDVIAEGSIAAARPGTTDTQHLLACHDEDVRNAEQRRHQQECEQRSGGETKTGASENEQARAKPRGLGVLAAIQIAAHLDGKDDRQNRKRRRDDAEPHHRQLELDRTIRCRHPDDGIDRLDDRDVEKQRHQQPVVDVARRRSGLASRRRLKFIPKARHRAPRPFDLRSISNTLRLRGHADSV